MGAIFIVCKLKEADVVTTSTEMKSIIYICNLDAIISKPKVMLITTVSDKMMKYTVRQVKQAELAREYQRKLGYASPGQVIKLIGQGKLVNSDNTAQDVVRYLNIWGPDLGTLKGKTPSHQRSESTRLNSSHS